MHDGDDMTELLHRASTGDRQAADAILEIAYQELHGLAGHFLRRERSDHTLQPTALVNEVYIKLFGQRSDWDGRQHFLAIAATIMRRVLADHARRKRAERRGGAWQRITLDGHGGAVSGPGIDLVALDTALEKLAVLHARQARIVELRFFAGMTVEQVAQELDVSRSTVEAEWRGARAWLHRELGDDGAA